MDAALKIVIDLPLREIWRADGFTSAARGRGLTRLDIKTLLQAGRVQFVVADVGEPLLWIPTKECFDFWKAEVADHIVDGPTADLNDYANNHCYFASKWASEYETAPIVLLEKSH